MVLLSIVEKQMRGTPLVNLHLVELEVAKGGGGVKLIVSPVFNTICFLAMLLEIHQVTNFKNKLAKAELFLIKLYLVKLKCDSYPNIDCNFS